MPKTSGREEIIEKHNFGVRRQNLGLSLQSKHLEVLRGRVASKKLRSNHVRGRRARGEHGVSEPKRSQGSQEESG